MEAILRELPPHYDNPEKAPATFCLSCSNTLVFNHKDTNRWACPCCDWVFLDSPQPTATTLLVLDGERPYERVEGPIDPSNSHVATIQRGIEPFRTQWALAGGYVDHNEDPRKAALRELREEMLLEADLLRFLGACHPTRAVPALRFRMNNLVLSWLAALASPGTPQAGDDAMDVAIHTAHSLPTLCFSSHDKIARDWFGGAYKWSERWSAPDSEIDKSLCKINCHCIRCATRMEWAPSIERMACPDSTCGWVYWCSPVPHSAAILRDERSRILLHNKKGLWTLPQAPVPAYHTPRESVEALLGAGRLPLTHNLSAERGSMPNTVQILFGGEWNREAPRGFELYDLDRLPQDLDPHSLSTLLQFQGGSLQKMATLR